MKGPGIFLAQFLSQEPPFNTLADIAQWAANLGFKGLQIPTNTKQLIDIELAAQSTGYCDDILGELADIGLQITELSTHIQGQLLAVHPAYNQMFDCFAPKELKGKYEAQRQWAHQQLLFAAKASKNLGLNSHATFSGSLLWPMFYPWPQRPQGLVEQGFEEIGKRWLPILNAFDDAGVDVCYELHPGEDLHDGITFERFLDTVNGHSRANILYDPSHMVLQQIDYLGFIDCYHDRIKAFHVKDAEFITSAKSGVYGGYQDWLHRPGRFRSLGDGQIDFKQIFSKLTQYDYTGWPVLEWECCLKHPEDGAREGAHFIEQHIIRKTTHAFDDFTASPSSLALNNALLGLK